MLRMIFDFSQNPWKNRNKSLMNCGTMLPKVKQIKKRWPQEKIRGHPQ